MYLQVPVVQRLSFARVLQSECANNEEFMAVVSALEELSPVDLRACLSGCELPVLRKILHAIECVTSVGDGWKTATRTTRRKTRKAKHDSRRISL
jgi:hypothetical protein